MVVQQFFILLQEQVVEEEEIVHLQLTEELAEVQVEEDGRGSPGAGTGNTPPTVSKPQGNNWRRWK